MTARRSTPGAAICVALALAPIHAVLAQDGVTVATDGLRLTWQVPVPPPRADPRAVAQRQQGCAETSIRFGDLADMRGTAPAIGWRDEQVTAASAAALTDAPEQSRALLEGLLADPGLSADARALLQNRAILSALQLGRADLARADLEAFGSLPANVAAPLRADRLWLRVRARVMPGRAEDGDVADAELAEALRLDPTAFTPRVLRIALWLRARRDRPAPHRAACAAAVEALVDRVLEMSAAGPCPLLVGHGLHAVDRMLAQGRRAGGANARGPDVARPRRGLSRLRVRQRCRLCTCRRRRTRRRAASLRQRRAGDAARAGARAVSPGAGMIALAAALGLAGLALVQPSRALGRTMAILLVAGAAWLAVWRGLQGVIAHSLPDWLDRAPWLAQIGPAGQSAVSGLVALGAFAAGALVAAGLARMTAGDPGDRLRGGPAAGLGALAALFTIVAAGLLRPGDLPLAAIVLVLGTLLGRLAATGRAPQSAAPAARAQSAGAAAASVPAAPSTPDRPSPPAFALRDVVVRYPGTAASESPALSIEALDIPARGVTAIIGPSGSGKTTLLSLLAGFQSPDPSSPARIDFAGAPLPATGHRPGRCRLRLPVADAAGRGVGGSERIAGLGGRPRRPPGRSRPRARTGGPPRGWA